MILTSCAYRPPPEPETEPVGFITQNRTLQWVCGRPTGDNRADNRALMLRVKTKKYAPYLYSHLFSVCLTLDFLGTQLVELLADFWSVGSNSIRTIGKLFENNSLLNGRFWSQKCGIEGPDQICRPKKFDELQKLF